MTVTKIRNYTGAPINMGVDGRYSSLAKIMFPSEGEARVRNDVGNPEQTVYNCGIFAESCKGERTVIRDWSRSNYVVEDLPDEEENQLIIVNKEVYNVLGGFRGDLRIFDPEEDDLYDPLYGFRENRNGREARKEFKRLLIEVIALRKICRATDKQLADRFSRAWKLAYQGSRLWVKNSYGQSDSREKSGLFDFIPYTCWRRNESGNFTLIISFRKGPAIWCDVDKLPVEEDKYTEFLGFPTRWEPQYEKLLEMLERFPE